MPGYSGVLQRQLEDEGAVRNFVKERLDRQNDRHEAILKDGAKKFLPELKKRQPEAKKRDVQRDPRSSRTKLVPVRCVNEKPTMGRVRYFLTGVGGILWEGQFDKVLKEFDIRKAPLEEREELAGFFGIELYATD